MKEIINFKELEDYINQEINAVTHLVSLGINNEAVEVRYITLKEVLDKTNELKKSVSPSETDFPVRISLSETDLKRKEKFIKENFFSAEESFLQWTRIFNIGGVDFEILFYGEFKIPYFIVKNVKAAHGFDCGYDKKCIPCIKCIAITDLFLKGMNHNEQWEFAEKLKCEIGLPLFVLPLFPYDFDNWEYFWGDDVHASFSFIDDDSYDFTIYIDTEKKGLYLAGAESQYQPSGGIACDTYHYFCKTRDILGVTND